MHIYKICIEWKTDWSWVINTIHESNQWYTNGKGGDKSMNGNILCG